MRQIYSLLVMLTVSFTMLMAQESRTVTGVVLSEADGEPIIGASVVIPNSSEGTTTDIDGNFSIKVPTDVKTLRFSYVGMTTVELPVQNKMQVTLSENDKVLEDVVVTAQGLTRKEKSIGYAAQKLGGEDLTVSRPIDLANSMAGKVSGARILGGSGATFDVGTVVLRGTSDFQNPVGSEPIYVVDGIVTNKNAVNMDDVETLTVLKGAGATALYGSQGGNGAIIITTKRAKEGKTKVEFSHTTKWETYYNHIDVQNQYGGGAYGSYGEMYAIEGNDNLSWAGLEAINETLATNKRFLQKNTDGSYQYDMNKDESWGARYDKNVLVADAWYYDSTSSRAGVARPWVGRMDLSDLFRTGINNTSNVAVSTSGKGYNARVSFSNSQREGIMANSDAVRRFFSVRTSFDAGKYLTVGVDYKFTYHKNHNSASEGYNNGENVFYSLVEWGQTNIDIDDMKDYKRPDGSYRSWNITKTTDLSAKSHDNAFAVMNEVNRYHISFGHLFSADAEVKLPHNIKAGYKIMADMRNNKRESRYPDGFKKLSPSSYANQQYMVTDITSQARLTWGDRLMDNRLSVDAAAFWEGRQYKYSRLSSETANGLIDGKCGWWSVNNSISNAKTNNLDKTFKTYSVYANMTVGFDDTYFLDASYRWDADSRLDNPAKTSKDNYQYGSLSASVMLNKFVDADWLNYWKVRGSLAQLGSSLEPYDLDDPYILYQYGAQASFHHSSTQNADDLRPTITTSYEVGTEFRMFDHRFWGDVNFYIKNTTDQIFEQNVSPASGYDTRRINCGRIDNKGIEVSLGATLFRNRDWRWDVDFNVARNINKLVKLSDETSENVLASKKITKQWSLRAVEGEPVGVITINNQWKRTDDGRLILEKIDETKNAAKADLWGGGYAPIYDNDGNVNVGNYQPDFTGGFGTSLSWKNLSMNLSFDYMIGGQIVSLTNVYGQCSGILTSTVKKNKNGVCEREAIVNGGGVNVSGVVEVTDENGNVEYQDVECKMNAYNYYHYKSRYDLASSVYDRTYLKLRDVSVNYRFNKKLLEKMGIGLSEASVSFVANNLWLIYSACPNIDPSEANIDNSSSSNKLVSAFLEGGQAPSSRSYGFTVKVAF